MHPIEAFVRNPVKVTVGVLLVALFGVVALLRMPMQLTPEVSRPTITIETRWRGASPQEVEREIVQEQEEQLKSVEGVTKMSSESMDSMGRITLEFLVGSDMEEALLKVNSRLQQVPEYPLDADEPVIATSNAADRPIAWFIFSSRQPTDEELADYQRRYPELAAALDEVRGANSPGLALLRLRNLAKDHPEVSDLLHDDIDVTRLRRFAEDTIEARFERVPGVSNSNVLGGLEEELQVIVDPQRLAARQLTINDVRTALSIQNKDTTGGDFWEGKRRYVVRTLGQFRSPDQVSDQILAVRDGVPVYVRDVAEVQSGFKKPDGLVRRFGTSSIAINVQRETGANVLEVMQGLRAANQELNDQILRDRGLQLTQVYDETDYIYSAVGLVNQNILVGGLLTVAVLLIFLRSARSTLVIGVAIPSSIIGTFLFMKLMGRSLNVISLAGLAFAVGMLVDNAVVVLENIYRHNQQGERPFTAAVKGTKEVWGAVAASTFTTLAVFVPVLFIQQEAGQLFRDIALAISAAVGLSLLFSVTLIPTAAARLLRGASTKRESGRRPRAINSLFALLDRFGRAFVTLVIGTNSWIQQGVARRLIVVGGLVVSAGALSWLMWPKVEYLPTGNRNLVFGIVMPPPGYNLEELTQLGKTVEAELRPYWDIPVGETHPEFAAIGDFFYVARGRQIFVGVRALESTRAGELVPIVGNIREKLPGTLVVAKQSSLFEQGLTAGRTVDIEITGPDLNNLVALGGRVMGQLMNPQATPVPNAQAIPRPSLDLSSPEVHVRPRLVQAADLQMNATDLGYAVNALVDGAYATDYFIGGDKIDLTIIGRESAVGVTQDLDALPVASATGELVPLAAVADVGLSSGPEQINHRERQRAITIEVTPPPEMALEDAIRQINRQIVAPLQNEGALDGGYVITLSGTADKLQETWDALWANLLLAVLITYLLMAALFESWIHPLVIIFSVLWGAVGGVLGLRLQNAYQWFMVSFAGWHPQPPQTLDVLTMLGFVILVGTVVNNAILIVHQSLNHMRDDGQPAGEAILESLRTRIRPIFMTTTTTVFGLAPLVFFPGAGSELYRGLGSVVLGGLVVSTLFTLVLVPTVFSLMLDARTALARLVWGTSVDELSDELRGDEPVADEDELGIFEEDRETRIVRPSRETVRADAEGPPSPHDAGQRENENKVFTESDAVADGEVASFRRTFDDPPVE